MAAAVDLAVLARPSTMTPVELEVLGGIYSSLQSSGQRMRKATAQQCEDVYLSEERRKMMRDSDTTSPDLKEICGNGGDFYDCVVADKDCALSKNAYTCVNRILRPPEKRRATRVPLCHSNPTTTPFAHSTTITFHGFSVLAIIGERDTITGLKLEYFSAHTHNSRAGIGRQKLHQIFHLRFKSAFM